MRENDIAPELSAIEVGASEAVSSLRAIPLANFNLLWIGQAVSVIGSQFSSLSIQMIAATTLRANPTEMGLLTASQTFPYLVLSLFIGVLVDRMPRKSLLI